MRGWAWIFEGRGEEGPRTDWLWHSSLAHSQRVRMICVAVGPKTEANFEDICVGSKSGLSNISAILPWTFFPASDWCEPCTSAAIDGDVVIIVDFVHCIWGKFCPGIHADGAKPASTWPEGELSSVIDFAAWTISKCFTSLLKNTKVYTTVRLRWVDWVAGSSDFHCCPNRCTIQDLCLNRGFSILLFRM